ncbi:MAG TPA: TMEM165/GDT1 family protein [Caulobacterales bacterium]|jgi:putative Ca2+/H+ antiporter (TMEM165/GDT1 family)|nr:TMEM165/GDT1 family protein [Caulobacterales bacterium]
METLLTSIGLVALAEIGDKTQLLAILLAAKFKRPVTIIAGILAATIANHLLAAGLGFALSDYLDGAWFKIAIAIGFIAMGLWALMPDKIDDVGARERGGVFATTVIAFFLVEIGDKTQIATSLLAARFHTVALVALGTTIGMMIANIPAVYFGEAVTKIVPPRYLRWSAAAVFVVLGLVALAAAAPCAAPFCAPA